MVQCYKIQSRVCLRMAKNNYTRWVSALIPRKHTLSFFFWDGRNNQYIILVPIATKRGWWIALMPSYFCVPGALTILILLILLIFPFWIRRGNLELGGVSGYIVELDTSSWTSTLTIQTFSPVDDDDSYTCVAQNTAGQSVSASLSLYLSELKYESTTYHFLSYTCVFSSMTTVLNKVLRYSR